MKNSWQLSVVQARNFITFELKVFRHEERETQSFYADCFYIVSSQPNHSAQICLALPSSKSRLSHSEAGTQLSAFYQIPKSSAHASGAWHHLHPLVPITIWGFILTSVNNASSPCTREHRHSCLHLTNPCTEPKGSHPN